MTAPATRTAGAPATLPPWPLLWLAAYAIALPSSFSSWWASMADLSGSGSYARDVVGTPSFVLLQVITIAHLVPIAVLLVGVLAVCLPAVRAAVMERRLGLVPADRPVLLEIERFLARHGAHVEVRANLTRGGRLVRVYPVGLRRARVAVFGPFVVLWRRDRAAGEAVLLHEVAHLRTGDQLLLGLGSPFVALVNLWLPLLLLVGVLPVVAFVVVGYPTAVPLAGQLVLMVTLVPRALLLPVAALWAAELSADLYVAHQGRAADLFRALSAVGPTGGRRGRLSLRLSHPPDALRRWVVAGGPGRATAVLAAWPMAVFALLALVIAGAVPASLLVGASPEQVVETVRAGVGRFLLDSARVWLPAAALLLLWPWLGRMWTRWWSGRDASPSAVPWGRYVLAAVMTPVLVVLLLVVTG